MRQAPIVIAVYATLAITLGGQWIAAKLGVTAVPALELSTMRFAIAAVVLLVAPGRRSHGAWRRDGVGSESDDRRGRPAEGDRAGLRHSDGPHRDGAAAAARRRAAGLPRRAFLEYRDVARGRIPRRVLDLRRVRPVLLGPPSVPRDSRGDGDLPHADRDPRARVPGPGRASAAVAARWWSGDRRRRAPGGASVTRGARPGTGDDLSESSLRWA